MKKGLKIIDGLYINMDHIVTLEVVSEDLVIGLDSTSESTPNSLYIALKDDAFSSDRMSGFRVNGIEHVEIQELHRIKREIYNYLGIAEPVLIK